MNGNTMVITPEDQMNWDTIAELRKELDALKEWQFQTKHVGAHNTRLIEELDAAHRGAVGLNIRIAELHQQLADAKAQIADYEAAIKRIIEYVDANNYSTEFDKHITALAKKPLNKWSKSD